MDLKERILFISISILISVTSVLVLYLAIRDGLNSSTTDVETPDLETVTAGALYLKDRGDGTMDLVVKGNIQMIGSTDDAVTYKNGRIVFNHTESDIHGIKSKAMIGRSPGNGEQASLSMTMKNAQGGNDLSWVSFYCDQLDTHTTPGGSTLYYSHHFNEDYSLVDDTDFDMMS
jgi:hypothetical protein